MTHASAAHRRLDRGFADTLARDGDQPAPGRTLVASRDRLKDLRSMNTARVPLMTLSRRTSTKGNEYLSGWLGKAAVVAFPGSPDKFGNPTWDVFVRQPESRDGSPTPRRPVVEHEATSAGAGALPGNSRPNTTR